MKSAGVCISIPVRNMAMQSSAKYFATMTGMLMEYKSIIRDLSENRRLPKMELYVMIQSRK